MSKVLITYVNRYDFTDSRTGRQIKGSKVHFVNPQISVARPEDQKGMTPIEMGVAFEDFSKYPTVPGIYELNIDNIPAGGGKLTAVISGVKFVKEYKINLD